MLLHSEERCQCRLEIRTSTTAHCRDSGGGSGSHSEEPVTACTRGLVAKYLESGPVSTRNSYPESAPKSGGHKRRDWRQSRYRASFTLKHTKQYKKCGLKSLAACLRIDISIFPTENHLDTTRAYQNVRAEQVRCLALGSHIGICSSNR